MPKGNIALAIKFADLITPNPPTPPKKASAFTRLPKPTEDIEQVKRDVKEFGYGLVKNALTPEQVAIMKKAVQEQAAGENAAGKGQADGGPGGPNQRIWTRMCFHSLAPSLIVLPSMKTSFTQGTANTVAP